MSAPAPEEMPERGLLQRGLPQRGLLLWAMPAVAVVAGLLVWALGGRDI